MSQIKTNEIEGDVSIGRHVTAGGNATIQGHATVKKNLKVEGWLEAKNIKGPNKGLFATVTKLNEAYPMPHDGWCALVGDTLPAALYIADGGSWVATGKTAGTPAINSQQYDDAISDLSAELIMTENDVANLKLRVTAAEGDIDDINDLKGSANGIAPLGVDAKVPESYLPKKILGKDVVEFWAIRQGNAPLIPTLLSKKSTDEGCTVVYLKNYKIFALLVAGQLNPYNNWLDADDYGVHNSEAGGRVPECNKAYICTSTNEIYRWDGTDMVLIGSGLVLGDTEGKAFPGDAGKALQESLETIGTLKPIRIEDEEHLEAMRLLGLLKEGQMYYIPEED